MPVIVHVKHYLSASSLVAFKSWYQSVYQFMSEKTGFMDLSYQVFPAEETGDLLIYIKLIFADTHLLEAWVNDPVHDQLVNDLDCYRSRCYWQACRTTDENLCWTEATYDVIDALTPHLSSQSD